MPEYERRTFYRYRKLLKVLSRFRCLSLLAEQKRFDSQSETTEQKLKIVTQKQQMGEDCRTHQELEKPPNFYFFFRAKRRSKTSPRIWIPYVQRKFLTCSKEMCQVFRKEYESMFREPVNILKTDDPKELFTNISPPPTNMSIFHFASSDFRSHQRHSQAAPAPVPG